MLIDVADLSVRAQPEGTWDLAQVVVHHDGPPEVRRWLRGPAKMRIVGSAYHPASDADYAITVGFWRGAFDAVLHLDRITPSRLLAAAPGPP